MHQGRGRRAPEQLASGPRRPRDRPPAHAEEAAAVAVAAATEGGGELGLGGEVEVEEQE